MTHDYKRHGTTTLFAPRRAGVMRPRDCRSAYNVRVADIQGRGRIKHGEFAFASGEHGFLPG
jgi:hypothetical protein